jgi:hypothetical protein
MCLEEFNTFLYLLPINHNTNNVISAVKLHEEIFTDLQVKSGQVK